MAVFHSASIVASASNEVLASLHLREHGPGQYAVRSLFTAFPKAADCFKVIFASIFDHG